MIAKSEYLNMNKIENDFEFDPASQTGMLNQPQSCTANRHVTLPSIEASIKVLSGPFLNPSKLDSRNPRDERQTRQLLSNLLHGSLLKIMHTIMQ